MRKAICLLKVFMLLALSAGCALFARAAIASPVFAEGEKYELYLSDSAGSILSTEHPARDKLFLPVKGESARYAGDVSSQLIARFKARLVAEEKTGDVTNYYLFSPLIKESVQLSFGEVNLHIAVREEETAAGTPLIFGGF